MQKLFLSILLSTVVLSSSAQTTGWSWARNAKSTESGGNSVATDFYGSVYVGGFFNDSTISFGAISLNGNGGSNVFLVKYDSSGNVIWAKSSIGNGNAYISGLTTDISGNIYMTGTFTDSSITFGTIKLSQNPINNSTTGIFIVKYNHDGNVIWATNAQGSLNDESNSIVTDASGNIYVTGFFDSPSITFGSITLTNDTTSGSSDIFIVKYDTSGKVVWTKSYGGSSNDVATSVAADVLGNIYISGYFGSSSVVFGPTTLVNDSSSSLVDDLFIAKCDTNGQVEWAKSAGGGIASSVACDVLGNIYLGGYYHGPSIIFSPDTLNDVGYSNTFFVKYNSIGNVMWAKSAAGNNRVTSLAISPVGNIYIAGFFYTNPVTFDTITLYKGDGGSAIFIVKYDSSGKALWGYSVGGDEQFADDVAQSVATDALGNTYLTGDFTSDSITFGYTTLFNNINEISASMFLAKIGLVSTGIYQLPVISNNLIVYPNPNNGNFKIQFSDLKQNAQLEIYNVLGEKIYTSNVNSNNTQIEMSNKMAGIYLYQLITVDGQFISSGKLVIE